MKVKTYITVILIIATAGMMSCKKSSTLPPVDMGYNFFPVNTGHTVTYRVDSISWNDFTGSVDTFSYQVREIIESEFTDFSGRICQRLLRQKRADDTSQWQIKDVWQINRTASTAEKVEENIRYVKLTFPVTKGNVWNGNLYNTGGEQEYRFKEVYHTWNSGLLSFDSCLTVLQKEYYTLISEDFQQEIYATGVGLVYRKYKKISKKPTGEISSGIDYSYTIISYEN